MSRRLSTSSEVSWSALSEAPTTTTTTTTTTAQPLLVKDHAADSSTKTSKSKKKSSSRRGLRQKARDVLSDMGSPPTKRHDAKTGGAEATTKYQELGLMGAAVTAQTARI